MDMRRPTASCAGEWKQSNQAVVSRKDHDYHCQSCARIGLVPVIPRLGPGSQTRPTVPEPWVSSVATATRPTAAKLPFSLARLKR